MEWYELSKEEVDRYNNLPPEEVKNIINQGIQTEFWKYFRAKLSNTLKSADVNLKRRKVQIQDDLISLAIWQTIYKTAEEVFSFPENTLKAIESSKNTVRPGTPSTGVKPQRGF